jgi:chemotaxis signal transduction protein
MPVEHVIEVADLGAVAPVPGAPPEILGVTDLRGQIVPVVDLAMLLGVSRTQPPRRMLLVEALGGRAGFAIDEVIDVAELAEPAEETDGDLLCGATLAGGELIGVVDVTRVFERLERPGQ